MGDPITPVLGAMAAVTGLLKAGRSTYSFLKDLHHAPDLVSEIQVEVEGFNISIDGVRLALIDPEVESRIASAQTHLVFAKAKETLYQLQETLSKVAQGPGSEVSRPKWVYHHSRCRELKEQLVAHRNSLNAIILAAHS